LLLALISEPFRGDFHGFENIRELCEAREIEARLFNWLTFD
jgi:hypothetical protein